MTSLAFSLIMYTAVTMKSLSTTAISSSSFSPILQVLADPGKIDAHFDPKISQLFARTYP